MTRTTRVLWMAGAMLWAAALPGCNIAGPAFYFIHGPEKVKKQHTLDAKKPTVVFIDDRLNRIPHRASRVSMGEQCEVTLMKQKAVKDMISSQSAMQAAGVDRGGKPVPITEVGEAIKADVVIYAMVDEFALTRDGQTFSPGASVRVKVIEVATGKRLWPEQKAGYPLVVRMTPKQGTAPENTAARFAAEDELARQVGQEIAWLFFDHEAPKGLRAVEQPMRVLHLIDGGFRALGDPLEFDSLLLACRLLVERAGHQQSVCIMGPRRTAERARNLGLRVDAAIAPILGLPESAWPSLRRYAAGAGRPEVVQCWGGRAGRLALRAFGDALPRVTIVRPGETGPGEATLSLSGGAESLTVLPPPVLPIDAQRREVIRAALGVPEQEAVLLLLGSATRDAMRFTFLCGLLTKSGVRLTGITTPGVGQPARRRFQRGREWVTIIRTRRSALDVLPACDLAVFDGGGPSPTADWPECPGAGEQVIAQAHAAGVPVVAPRWAASDAGYSAEADALLRGANGTLTELGRRIAALVQEPPLRGRLARSVLEYSGRRDTAGAFVAAVKGAWELAAPAEPAHA